MAFKKTTNPYREIKAMSERILSDAANTNDKFTVSLLRYFNPIGSLERRLIGKDPNGIPNNLMPYVSKVAKGKLKELSIFDDNYDTVDGTA